MLLLSLLLWSESNFDLEQSDPNTHTFYTKAYYHNFYPPFSLVKLAWTKTYLPVRLA